MPISDASAGGTWCDQGLQGGQALLEPLDFANMQASCTVTVVVTKGSPDLDGDVQNEIEDYISVGHMGLNHILVCLV